MNDTRRYLDVILTDHGTEFKVRKDHNDQGNLVMVLEHATPEEARRAAYNYVWDRGKYMWTIRGIVE